MLEIKWIWVEGDCTRAPLFLPKMSLPIKRTYHTMVSSKAFCFLHVIKFYENFSHYFFLLATHSFPKFITWPPRFTCYHNGSKITSTLLVDKSNVLFWGNFGFDHLVSLHMLLLKATLLPLSYFRYFFSLKIRKYLLSLSSISSLPTLSPFNRRPQNYLTEG